MYKEIFAFLISQSFNYFRLLFLILSLRSAYQPIRSQPAHTRWH